jgi:hypothetical protein
LISGADSFTPDGRLIMNESAEVRHWFNKKTYSNQINNRLD